MTHDFFLIYGTCTPVVYYPVTLRYTSLSLQFSHLTKWFLILRWFDVVIHQCNYQNFNWCNKGYCQKAFYQHTKRGFPKIFISYDTFPSTYKETDTTFFSRMQEIIKRRAFGGSYFAKNWSVKTHGLLKVKSFINSFLFRHKTVRNFFALHQLLCFILSQDHFQPHIVESEFELQIYENNFLTHFEYKTVTSEYVGETMKFATSL